MLTVEGRIKRIGIGEKRRGLLVSCLPSQNPFDSMGYALRPERRERQGSMGFRVRGRWDIRGKPRFPRGNPRSYRPDRVDRTRGFDSRRPSVRTTDVEGRTATRRRPTVSTFVRVRRGLGRRSPPCTGRWGPRRPPENSPVRLGVQPRRPYRPCDPIGIHPKMAVFEVGFSAGRGRSSGGYLKGGRRG
jgi:hypothetical protein